MQDYITHDYVSPPATANQNGTTKQSYFSSSTESRYVNDNGQTQFDSREEYNSSGDGMQCNGDINFQLSDVEQLDEQGLFDTLTVFNKDVMDFSKALGSHWQAVAAQVHGGYDECDAQVVAARAELTDVLGEKFVDAIITEAIDNNGRLNERALALVIRALRASIARRAYKVHEDFDFDMQVGAGGSSYQFAASSSVSGDFASGISMPPLPSSTISNSVSQMVERLIFKDCQAVLILAGATEEFISETWQDLRSPVANIVSTIIKISYVTKAPKIRGQVGLLWVSTGELVDDSVMEVVPSELNDDELGTHLGQRRVVATVALGLGPLPGFISASNSILAMPKVLYAA